MVALEFISQLDKLRFVDSVGLDDFADRCSYMLSFALLVICFTIVTLKSYVFEPLSCYVPTTFSGSNLGPYINAFCWINGTTPMSADTDRLDDQEYWNSLEDKKISEFFFRLADSVSYMSTDSLPLGLCLVGTIWKF